MNLLLLPCCSSSSPPLRAFFHIYQFHSKTSSLSLHFPFAFQHDFFSFLAFICITHSSHLLSHLLLLRFHCFPLLFIAFHHITFLCFAFLSLVLSFPCFKFSLFQFRSNIRLQLTSSSSSRRSSLCVVQFKRQDSVKMFPVLQSS